MNETRKKILDVSLELFSQKGYSAVSIRDICKYVEIKESSVYYHFKNKQAIFEELLMIFENIATTMMQQLENGLAEPIHSEKDNFYERVCAVYFENYLMDDFCNKMMRLLMIEQFDNEEIQKLYDLWMFAKPIEFQSKVFGMLASIGYIKNKDADYLAVKYYAPIYYYLQRWLLSGILTDEKKDAFRANAYQHIEKFFKEI